MPIPLTDFGALPQPEQLALLAQQGALLTELGQGAYRVKLYHLPGGFFCEVYLDIEHRVVLQVLPFTSTDQLDDYTAAITLPELAALPLIHLAAAPPRPAPSAAPRPSWSLRGLLRGLWERLLQRKRGRTPRAAAGSASVEVTRSGLPAATKRPSRANTPLRPGDPGKP
ncbi:hypothetical protein [Hymenobacter daeguensis]